MNAFENYIGFNPQVTTLFIHNIGKHELDTPMKLNETYLDRIIETNVIMTVGCTYLIDGREYYSNFPVPMLRNMVKNWKKEREAFMNEDGELDFRLKTETSN